MSLYTLFKICVLKHFGVRGSFLSVRSCNTGKYSLLNLPSESGKLSTIIPHNHGITITYYTGQGEI